MSAIFGPPKSIPEFSELSAEERHRVWTRCLEQAESGSAYCRVRGQLTVAILIGCVSFGPLYDWLGNTAAAGLFFCLATAFVAVAVTRDAKARDHVADAMGERQDASEQQQGNGVGTNWVVVRCLLLVVALLTTILAVALGRHYDLAGGYALAVVGWWAVSTVLTLATIRYRLLFGSTIVIVGRFILSEAGLLASGTPHWVALVFEVTGGLAVCCCLTALLGKAFLDRRGARRPTEHEQPGE